jgi:hypothetical protein
MDWRNKDVYPLQKKIPNNSSRTHKKTIRSKKEFIGKIEQKSDVQLSEMKIPNIFILLQ